MKKKLFPNYKLISFNFTKTGAKWRGDPSGKTRKNLIRKEMVLQSKKDKSLLSFQYCSLICELIHETAEIFNTKPNIEEERKYIHCWTNLLLLINKKHFDREKIKKEEIEEILKQFDYEDRRRFHE
jgi:hypothetical protein